MDAGAEATYQDWRLSLNVNNLADEEFHANCCTWAVPFDGMCMPGQTRSILGTVSKKF